LRISEKRDPVEDGFFLSSRETSRPTRFQIPSGGSNPLNSTACFMVFNLLPACLLDPQAAGQHSCPCHSTHPAEPRQRQPPTFRQHLSICGLCAEFYLPGLLRYLAQPLYRFLPMRGAIQKVNGDDKSYYQESKQPQLDHSVPERHSRFSRPVTSFH